MKRLTPEQKEDFKEALGVLIGAIPILAVWALLGFGYVYGAFLIMEQLFR